MSPLSSTAGVPSRAEKRLIHTETPRSDILKRGGTLPPLTVIESRSPCIDDVRSSSTNAPPSVQIESVTLSLLARLTQHR